MNKKEKGFLENNLYECEMSRLRTAAKMKDKKTKESRFVAHAAKFAAEEMEVICRHLIPDLDIENVKKRAKETFELEKG